MSKGFHTTKTGETVYVTPLGNGRYRLDYDNGQTTFV